jgi:ATP-dependent DNA helicase RecG
MNRMIEACLKQGLPEPLFEEISGSLVVTLRKEITEEFSRERGLNERQIKAVFYVREKGKITNKEYQELCMVSRCCQL